MDPRGKTQTTAAEAAEAATTTTTKNKVAGIAKMGKWVKKIVSRVPSALSTLLIGDRWFQLQFALTYVQ